MKKFFNSLYGKIAIVYLLLLLVSGTILIRSTVDTSMKFVQESDQKLNRDLAKNL